MTEHTFSVSGIHCESCESRIQTELGRLDGLEGVKADHNQQTVTVRYDSAVLDEATVGARLDALGYPLAAG